ncbi:CC0125/CC1285 family lipoprotein [Aliiglaciecola litoralis]|uniref:Lipoprotein n=1 Tax=Aliiglaciecola litoralis TaxID=582857 RepID=A0ABN1LQ96_9ALTE
MRVVYTFISSPVFKTLLMIMLSIIMTACATVAPTPYSQAEDYGKLGYANKKLSNDQYQVIFTGNNNTDVQKAKDYALLHAANLTLEKGFAWFEIIDSDADQETKTVTRVSPTPVVARETTSTCGLLGCTISNASTYQGSTTTTQVVADKVVATLLIKMGKNNPENPNKVFDAKALSTNLSRSI